MTHHVLFDFAGLPRQAIDAITAQHPLPIDRWYHHADPSNLRPSLMWDPPTMTCVLVLQDNDPRLSNLLATIQFEGPLMPPSVVLVHDDIFWYDSPPPEPHRVVSATLPRSGAANGTLLLVRTTHQLPVARQICYLPQTD